MCLYVLGLRNESYEICQKVERILMLYLSDKFLFNDNFSGDVIVCLDSFNFHI